MKRFFHFMTVIALAALTLTGCDDVPMPYNQPNIKPNEATVTPSGTGTAEDPYNVAAALQLVNSLGADETTANAIYVKGKVTGTPEIETEKYGNATYYITDDGSNKIYIFQSYYLGNRKFTANDKLNDGDEVVIYGKFTNYKGNTPETVGKGASYIYSLNGKTEGGSDTPTPGEKGSSKDNPLSTSEAVDIINSGNIPTTEVYVKGIISSVDYYNSKYHSISYYLSDDGKSKVLDVYSGKGLNGADFADKSDLQVGQTVIVKGKLELFTDKKGNKIPEISQSSQIVSIEGSGSTPETPETPGTSEGITISGTTVTLTNKAYTAGTTTATLDLSTLSFGNGEAVTTITLSDGSTVTFDSNGETNGPKYYTATKGVRVYKNNTVTIEGKANIASIVFECDRYNKINQVGNSTATITFSGKKAVYTNVLKDATGGGVQLRIQKIIVTYAK